MYADPCGRDIRKIQSTRTRRTCPSDKYACCKDKHARQGHAVYVREETIKGVMLLCVLYIYRARILKGAGV